MVLSHAPPRRALPPLSPTSPQSFSFFCPNPLLNPFITNIDIIAQQSISGRVDMNAIIWAFMSTILSINIMNKGNTVFYHRHIQSNISHLDQRKDKFINHRLEFLREYCEPIQEKIALIQKEIQRYKIMRDTQEEVIENDPSILSIKEELRNYMQTHQYYEEKLSEYEKKSIEMEQYNNELAKRIAVMRTGIKSHREELGFRLPSINRTRMKTSSYQKEEQEASINRSHFLPDLKNQTEDNIAASESKSTKAEQKKRIIGISEKIQRVKSHQLPQEEKASCIEQSKSVEKQQERNQLKRKAQQLREKITQFNRTQILFHQCFQAKKAGVQKSVSQLQSKLITNRAEFLNTCQAIGSKQTKISFQAFNVLSCEQIITLFISFVWLNRKLNSQFLRKRKDIMQLMKKLPKVD